MYQLHHMIYQEAKEELHREITDPVHLEYGQNADFKEEQNAVVVPVVLGIGGNNNLYPNN